MKDAPSFKFSKEKEEELRNTIKSYFLDELDMEIGDLQANLFVEFLNENVGKHYYNLGVTDSIQMVKEQAENLVMLVKE